MIERSTPHQMAIAANQQVEEREYWLNRLAGEPVKSYFPYDFQEDHKTERQKGAERFFIEKDIFKRLMKICVGSDSRLHIILTANLMALLCKYSGASDFIIGVPVHKQQFDSEPINIALPIRSYLHDGLTFKEILLQERMNIFEAEEHQNYPVEILAEQLGFPVDDGTFSLFEIVLLLENIHDKTLLRHLQLNLVFSFIRTEKGLEGTVEYNAALYRSSTIRQIICHFSNLLERVLTMVDARLEDIDILSKEEKNRLLREFNNTGTVYPKDTPVNQLFSEQVEKTPDDMAIIFEDQYITYRELARRTDALALLLREKGVTQNSIAGLMMERSIEMIVGMLAILKAGGAYLPIDPTYPFSRVLYLLKDSNTTVLLTVGGLIVGDEFDYDEEIIDISTSEFCKRKSEGIENTNDASDLAYVIYTSGSTGKPKGVMIEHRNVVNFIKGIAVPIGFSPGETILAVTTISFDISVLEILLPLSTGLKVVMANARQQLEPVQLETVIINNRIDILQLTPTRLSLLLEGARNTAFLKGVSRLLVGGEHFSTHLFQLLMVVYSGSIYNVYGPTETTVWSTIRDLTSQKDGEIDIGSPLANTQIYILNGKQHLIPIGAVGELCIGGDGVGRGYLNSPRLTAENFIESRELARFHSKESHDVTNRIYRTGDLARWLPDGNIQFLGRIDYQVKVRGFRIELGEIESRLLTYPFVQDTVVIDREDNNGNKYLCAYLVSSSEFSVSALREHLAEKLPDFMIPSYFVLLDEIPLTVNGKINRKALPEPGLPGDSRDIVKPRNDIEKVMVQIWAEVLGVENTSVGIDNNFFNLGGNSLKIALLAAKLHRQLWVRVKLSDIYAHPTIREFSHLIKSLDREACPAISPAPREPYYPLSSAQQRLYILREVDKQGTSYNMPLFAVLQGDLDTKRFEDTINALIQRHESFRTSFQTREGTPVQIIAGDVPDAPFKIEYHRVENWGGEEPIINEFVRPFDLTRAPLLRVGLIHIENTHILMVDMHHIIADGTSLQLFKQEFLTLYRGHSLPALSIQYKDYAYWQAGNRDNVVQQKQQAYWLEHLDCEIPVSILPTDYPRPVTQSFEGRVEDFEISVKDTALLKTVTPDEGVTLYMTLLAVLDIFLAKITGQKEIIVGTPAADRRHDQLQDIIGMFANTLAMHSRPLPDKRFNEFLQEIKANTLDALENQDYQFGELVKQLTKKNRLNHDTSRNPLFDVLFVHQDTDLAEETIPGLKLLPYKYENRTAKFDLTFHAVESGEKILFDLEYSTALFKRETILRFIDYFKQIVDIVTGDPTIKLGDIEIIGERERKEILAMSRGDCDNASPSLTVHRLFERKALEMGKKHALVFDGAALSYRELNLAADRLSARLRARGVHPGTIVGLMLPRSFPMVTAMLAILKAGAAYLPIDPGLPAGRKKYMLQNAGTCHLLTTSQIGDTRDWLHEGIEIIDATTGTETETETGDCSLAPDVKGSDLAYVIYTSGSHGRPKGVMMEHRSLVNLIRYHLMHTAIDFSSVLQYAPASFDVSFQEIFTTLLAGGTLYLVDNETRLNPPVLFDLVKRCDIKTLFLPAALLRTLFKEVTGISSPPPNITHIVSSGEKLVVHDRLRYYLQENNIHLHNHYGPTETHVVTSLILSPDEDIPPFPTIGRPVFNTTVYILDNRLKLQPAGIPGEIYIAGRQVSRGYVNDLELTAERFRHDPFSPTQPYRPKPHDRLYRTGDVGCRLADGSIRFLGRVDNQIKIRGHRVELEEIQRHILAVEGVSDAVVVFPEEGDGNLYAYIVAREELDLHNILAQHLPGYMLPTDFINVEKIPLTSNGKPDLDILSSHGSIAFTNLNNYTDPRTPLEKKLQEIWSKVLEKPPEELIGIDANFFRLGGNSLRGMNLLALVYGELGVKLLMPDIFQNPTIRWLAAAIEQAPEKEDIPLELVPKKDAYQMSSAQYRLHSLHHREIDSTGYNIPIFVTLEGDVDRNRLEHAFNALIMRHESLRTSFHYDKDKKQAMQRIHPQVTFAMEYHDITGNSAGAPVNETDIIRQFIKPFDLKRSPLMRAGLVKLAKKKYLLMIDIHHINMDGIALTIFMEDLGRLYKEESLVPQRCHYKEYSEKQNRIKETEKVKKQKEYWMEQFAGEVPSVDLPLDHGRPMVQSFAGGLVEGVLDSEEAWALKKLGEREDVLPPTLMLALFNVLLAKICSQEDIVVGIPHTDFSDCLRYRIIGVFVNSLPLRNRPEPGKHFNDFLKEVKASAELALKNADYQYDDLVEQLAISNDVSRNPLFSTMFLYQHPVSLAVDIPGLRIYPYNYNHHSAKFDLSLHVIEEDDHLCLRFEYCTKLFKEETVHRFKEYFRNITSAVIENPRIKLVDIDVYSTAEKNRLLYEFNETDVQYPNHYTIHQLFEEQVKRVPHHTAVFFKGKGVSYRQLNEKANQLAGTLRQKGAKAGTIHAIMADRSVEMITGILAILKAGGAYLPIEPLYYPERRGLQILEDSAVHSVLTDGSASVSPAIEKMVPIIYIKDLHSTANETSDLVNVNNPDDLAYVIYTSGAMGRPKGIMVEHKNVINLVLGLKDRIFSQHRSPLKFCLIASYMFDASVQQIFGALLAGHSLDIVPDPCRKNGARLLSFYNKHRIDISDGTPHHLRLLLQGLSDRVPEAVIAVKHFLIGGEALPKNLVKQFFDRFDGRAPRITNVYGPAECCVDTTSFQLTKDRLHTLSTIPIGTPLPNYRVYIVNEDNRPQPIGVAGELCISGAGMARGYLNLPELTAERFIRNGGKKSFYRTGDRVRWLSDGNIEFLGRIDQQVKLKGFRIELEEIENHLCSHSEISAAAVSVKEFTDEMRCADELTNKFLCAYYQAPRELKKWKLQAFLSKRLPAYMIPTYFVRMKEIPILKPNYKIDRGKLPEIVFKPEPPVAPENKIQEKLKEILEDALEIKPISIYDSIFDLGAHSFKATAITSLISMEFHIAIDIKEIYENPTISQLDTIVSGREAPRESAV